MAHTHPAEPVQSWASSWAVPTITQKSASWQEPQQPATYLLQNALGVLWSQSTLKCQTYTQHCLHQEKPRYRAPTAPILTPKCAPSSGCPVDNKKPTSILANKRGQGLGWDNGTQYLSCEFSACFLAWIWPRLITAFPNDAWIYFRDQYKLRALPVLDVASLLWGAEGFSCWTEATSS